MKRIFSMLMFFIMMISVLLMPAYAFDNENNMPINNSSVVSVTSDEVTVSKIMTFEEMVNRYAEVGGISYAEALTAFPRQSMRSIASSSSYRTVSVTLNVNTESGSLTTYHPTLEFYCKISVGDGNWGIISIYSVQMNRSSNNMTKQFGGDVQVWLRGPLSIEYVVNGDFYNNGTTTSSGGVNLELGIDDAAKVTFSSSNATSSNYYGYCYQHKTANF